MGSIRGQAMLEFALALPVFLLSMLIILDFGRAVWHYNSISSAVREGARYAIVRSHTDAQIRAHVKWAARGVDLSDSDIVIGPPVSRTPRRPVTVAISYSFRPITPLISRLAGDSLTLTASSRMLVEY